LKAKLYSGELELYRHEPLLVELGRIEAHYTVGSAGVRIPRVGKSHGDLAQAVALGCYALRQRPAKHQRKPRTGGYRLDPRTGAPDVDLSRGYSLERLNDR
jgi:hypothetical protein